MMTAALNPTTCKRTPRRKESERGAVLIFVAITLVVLIAFLAMAIDVGFMFTAKSHLQATIDAAALAGASGLPLGPAEARARAIEYAAKNPVYGRNVNLTSADIQLGTWNNTTRTFTGLPEDDEGQADSIRVTGNLTEARGNPLDLFFARIIGQDQADVRAQSVALAGTEVAWDIVILQDVTGSFVEELETALDADRGLLGCIADNAGENSRVGFAIHTGWGQVRSQLRSIEDGYADLVLIIDGVRSCGNPGMPVCSGTDQAAGMQAALSIFGTSGPNPYPNTKKAIVLVGDGQPNRSGNGSHPQLNNAQLAALAFDFADDAWDDEISVFTVFYDEANDDDAAQFFDDMTRGVGTFQRTPDPEDLGVLLGEVCTALIPGLRLVE